MIVCHICYESFVPFKYAYFHLNQCTISFHCRLGRKLRKFTQLKRNKRFDNFLMLVWVQGSPFHIAAGSHPVQEAWGSQDSLYRGSNSKVAYLNLTPCDPVASWTRCDPATIWNGDPWTHTNIMKLSNLLSLLSWVTFRSSWPRSIFLLYDIFIHHGQ